MALVEYLIARAGLPPRRGLAYDYVLAGDGLYLAGENRYLDVRVPVAPARVRGLSPIYPAFTLRSGRLPREIWEQIVEEARAWSRSGHEVLLAVTYDQAAGYRLVRPWQVVGPLQVVYQPLSDLVLEIHSHHRHAARFTGIDDADEQRLCVYGVLGHLDRDRPEVALRVGAYGYFLPLPWETVFTGDKGAFRDANVDPPEERPEEGAEDKEGDDGLPD